MNVVEANGARIPAIGLGTMTLKGDICVNAVKAAVQLGYRHIDTAERYGNESEVGEGLAEGLRGAGLKRDDVFVTTKVYHDKLAAADFQRGCFCHRAVGERSHGLDLDIHVGEHRLHHLERSDRLAELLAGVRVVDR